MERTIEMTTEQRVDRVLRGEEFVPEGCESLVERYHRLALVARCLLSKDDALLVDLEMDDLFDTMLGVSL